MQRRNPALSLLATGVLIAAIVPSPARADELSAALKELQERIEQDAARLRGELEHGCGELPLNLEAVKDLVGRRASLAIVAAVRPRGRDDGAPGGGGS